MGWASVPPANMQVMMPDERTSFFSEQNPAMLSSAKGSPDWIFPQEKFNLADVEPGIRMRVLL
jgi:hypothetical protein